MFAVDRGLPRQIPEKADLRGGGGRGPDLLKSLGETVSYS
jgi:hypothetical protein